MLSGIPVSIKGTVLIVEDDPGVLGMAVSIVKSMGYPTLSVHNGDEALKVLAEIADVSLIFSDLVLPGQLSGVRLVEEARQLCPGLPFILATGYLNQLVQVRESIPKDIPLLKKPYRKAELARAFSELGFS